MVLIYQGADEALHYKRTILARGVPTEVTGSDAEALLARDDVTEHDDGKPSRARPRRSAEREED